MPDSRPVMPSFERLRAILFEPRNEWPRIAAERATAQSIAVGWVMVLAAIGPVAAFAGHVDLGVARATRIAIGGYATTLVVTFVLALIADALELGYVRTVEGYLACIDAANAPVA